MTNAPMIQVAINGNRKDPIIPITTKVIVESARMAIAKGATSIHVHPRDDYGNETLIGAFVDRQIGELRTKVIPIPIGISTGEWIEPDVDKRLEQIRSWKNLPDFVSINYDESGFEQVTEAVAEPGISIEVGLSNLKAAMNFTSSTLPGDVLRVLIEPQEQTLALALETIYQIETHLSNEGVSRPILLHGVDNTAWDLLILAVEKGYQTRIGFEDTLVLKNGELATTNAQLVEQARQIVAHSHSP